MSPTWHLGCGFRRGERTRETAWHQATRVPALGPGTNRTAQALGHPASFSRRRPAPALSSTSPGNCPPHATLLQHVTPSLSAPSCVPTALRSLLAFTPASHRICHLHPPLPSVPVPGLPFSPASPPVTPTLPPCTCPAQAFPGALRWQELGGALSQSGPVAPQS